MEEALKICFEKYLPPDTSFTRHGEFRLVMKNGNKLLYIDTHYRHVHAVYQRADGKYQISTMGTEGENPNTRTHREYENLQAVFTALLEMGAARATNILSALKKKYSLRILTLEQISRSSELLEALKNLT